MGLWARCLALSSRNPKVNETSPEILNLSKSRELNDDSVARPAFGPPPPVHWREEPLAAMVTFGLRIQDFRFPGSMLGS
jgi:hypothetical protein